MKKNTEAGGTNTCNRKARCITALKQANEVTATVLPDALPICAGIVTSRELYLISLYPTSLRDQFFILLPVHRDKLDELPFARKDTASVF